MTYGIGVWGGVLLTTASSECLGRLQLRIVKVLLGRFYPGDVCIFKAAKLLKFVDIYRLRAVTYLFKIIFLEDCPTLSAGMALNTVGHNYQTRQRNHIETPFPRVNAVFSSYKYQFVNIWNGLPAVIVRAASLKILKKNFITFTLDRY